MEDGRTGELLLAQEQFDEAEDVLRQALAIQERELGANHAQTARTLGHLGDIQRLAGDTARARWYYEQALQAYLTTHGDDHPRTRLVQARLSSLSS